VRQSLILDAEYQGQVGRKRAGLIQQCGPAVWPKAHGLRHFRVRYMQQLPKHRRQSEAEQFGRLVCAAPHCQQLHQTRAPQCGLLQGRTRRTFAHVLQQQHRQPPVQFIATQQQHQLLHATIFWNVG